MPVWPPGEAYSHPPKASYGVASLDRVSLRTCLKSPSPAGRSPQRAGSHAKCIRILRGARGRVGEGVEGCCS